MPVLSIHAYGFAATFKLKELESCLHPVGPGKVEKDRLLVPFDGTRCVIAYDFGAVVFAGIEPQTQAQIVAEITRRIPPEPYPPTTETFFLESQSGAAV